MPVRVAVDAMGGDQAPGVVIQGAFQALHASDDLEVLLFGPEDLLLEELDAHETTRILPLHLIDAPEVIGMDEAPAAAVKAKQGSSIHLGLGAHKHGQADAFVSAGNTGAVMAASVFILGRLQGVSRPSVIGYFPTTTGTSIVLDVGTNLDCKPEHLVQFAHMGSVYAQHILQREAPTVGLLNVGEEPGKGNDQVKAAYALLSEAPGINFVGNVEGRDIMRHAADVVVCDGFVGNVLLKFGESVAPLLMQLIGQEVTKQHLGEHEQQVVGRVMHGVQKRFNPEEFGGAPLLGVGGNVLIGHGSSSARAIERLILTAAEVARHNVAGSIASALDA